MYVHIHVGIYGQASGVPGLPPPLVWSGRGGEGGLACAETRGPLELPLDGGVVLGGAARARTPALRKPYSL